MQSDNASLGNRCIRSLDGVIISCFNYDETKDKREGVDLWIIDMKRNIYNLSHHEYKKDDLYGMFSKLDRLYKEGKLKRKAINTVLKEYSLNFNV
jgi:hypothetical protein